MIADTVFAPVQSTTAFEETLERLGTAIKLGLLPPGTRLPAERDLCEQLGIARSTLRQALTALVQSGHLHAVRGRGGGTFVAERARGQRPAEPRDPRRPGATAATCGSRSSSASPCWPPSAPSRRRSSGSTRWSPRWRPASTTSPRTGRPTCCFHIGLAEATGSAALVAAMTESQGAMTDLISYIAHPPEVLAWANAQHARLVDCLEGRDPSGAMRIMADHLRGTEHVLAGLLP